MRYWTYREFASSGIGRRIGDLASRFSRLCLALLVSLFGATTAAHAFGAIAVGNYNVNNLPNYSIAGISNDEPTPQEARDAAVQNCMENAAVFAAADPRITYQNDCSVITGYSGQHVHLFHILVVSNDFFDGIGDSAAAARSASLDSCVAKSGSTILTRADCENGLPALGVNDGTYLLIAEDTITTCPAGLNLNEGDASDTTDDTCGCPDGQIEIAGDCFTPASCTGGQVLNTATNECECPSEQVEIAGDCVARTTCTEGRELDVATNTCVCSSGQIEIGGDCVDRKTCTDGKELDTSDNTCQCPSGQVENDSSNCIARAACTDGKEFNAAENTCECSFGQVENDSGNCVAPATCPGGSVLNVGANACVCPIGQTEMDGVCLFDCGDGATADPAMNEVCESSCTRILADYNTASKTCMACGETEIFDFSDRSCKACQGDEEKEGNACVCPAGEVKDPENANACILNCTGGKMLVGDSCACPFGEVESASGICIVGEQGCQQEGETTIRVRGRDISICGMELPDVSEEIDNFYEKEENCESRPWDLDDDNNIAELCVRPQAGTRTSGDCIIRNNPGYEGNLGLCEDMLVNGQFPPGVSSQGGGVSSSSDAISSGKVVGIIGGLGFMTWLVLGGDPLALNFTPHAEISHNNGVNYYAYGSKVDYAEDNWTGYWQAAQIHSGNRVGNWIYGTGTSWSNDVFAASMTNTTRGANSDTAFSLSARAALNTWTVESAYIADWKVRALNDTWQNRLSLGASVVYEQWTITPKAELSWQAEDNIGDNARLRFDLSRDL